MSTPSAPEPEPGTHAAEREVPHDDESGELPTRQSLLSRLRSWDEQDSWREFFERYWRLIFHVARKAGLDEALAQDVVQDVIVTVAKEMPDFRYDPAKGPFKGWLMRITQRRTADAMRKRYRAGEGRHAPLDDPEVAEELSARAAGGPGDLEKQWEREWQAHLTAAAADRVKRQVKPEQYQIFELSVLKGWPVRTVAKALEVSVTQVYLARHRIGGLFKKELRRLEKQL